MNIKNFVRIKIPFYRNGISIAQKKSCVKPKKDLSHSRVQYILYVKCSTDHSTKTQVKNKHDI